MKMLRNRTVLFACLIAGCMALAGCGGKKSTDPNVGHYDAVGLEYDGFSLDTDADENYIELKDKGKLEIMLEGETSSGKWSLDGDEISIKLAHDSNDYTGVLDGGYLVVDLQGLVYTFYKEGGASGSVLQRLKDVENGVPVYAGKETEEDGRGDYFEDEDYWDDDSSYDVEDWNIDELLGDDWYEEEE
ncbi:MAG: hypothetical protein J5518_09945 [Lachnospiraceae bacterium]|nr:hypothetical protein [Lachnospiraceae bacterium]